jgi:hypothetical protein
VAAVCRDLTVTMRCSSSVNGILSLNISSSLGERVSYRNCRHVDSLSPVELRPPRSDRRRTRNDEENSTELTGWLP